jgi:hypothetical protein
MSLLYIFSYSAYFLTLSSFNFDTLCVLSVLLFALREAFKLYPVKREAAIFVHIRPYFIFLFFAHRVLLF